MKQTLNIGDILNGVNCIIFNFQGAISNNLVINWNMYRNGTETYYTGGADSDTQREETEHKEEDEEQGGNEQPVNLIFKKFHEGKAIDFFTIRKCIEEKLVNDIKFQYEWYAAYRIIDDLRLLDDLKLSSFAEQMNKWFPDAKVPCDADALGDYATEKMKCSTTSLIVLPMLLQSL